MAYTQHAQIRAQQRGIPPILIDLLLQFGAREKAGDGTQTYFFDKNARRQVRSYAGLLASSIEQHLDVYAIVGAGNEVITVAHRTGRINRN